MLQSASEFAAGLVIMSKVTRLEVDHFSIPLPVVLSDSTHGDMSEFGLITVRLTDDEGAQGMGYTYTVGNIGGYAVASLIDRDLRGVAEHHDAADIEGMWERMWWRIHFCGRGGLAAFAMAAVDVALWDLASRRADQPLWQALGGYDPKVMAYAGGIDLQFTTEALLAQADEFQASGFRAIKMKVGRDRLSEDVARVKAMREHLGDDFPLLADANMRWRVDEALRAARALAPYNLVWLEEPTIPDDIAGHVKIEREGGVPIATGENFHTIYEFEHMMQAGGVSFPEPDLATLGGISPWMKVARSAQSKNLPVTSHGVHDLHVHLLAAAPNASYLEAHGFGLERFIEQPLEIVDGYATAALRPGHGIVFDWNALEAHRCA